MSDLALSFATTFYQKPYAESRNADDEKTQKLLKTRSTSCQEHGFKSHRKRINHCKHHFDNSETAAASLYSRKQRLNSDQGFMISVSTKEAGTLKYLYILYHQV